MKKFRFKICIMLGLLLCCLFSSAVFAATKVSKVSINESSITTNIGVKVTLEAAVAPSKASNKSLSWKSSDTKIATVSRKGVVTPKGVGTVTITATAADGSKKHDTCTVKVKGMVKVELDSKTLSVPVTKTKVIKASVKYASDKVSWKSSNTKIATVSADGVVTGIAKGNVKITAVSQVDKTKKATCKVSVVQYVPVTNVTVSKSLISTYVGSKETITARITPSSASIQDLKYSSSDKNVAKVSSSGIITAMGEGSAVITIKSKDGTNKSAKCTVVVKKAISLRISPAALTINKNDTYSLQAKVSNGTASKVKWSSADTKVATVSSTGLVKGIRSGTTTITLQSTEDTSKKATCVVAVIGPSLTLSADTKTLNSGDTASLIATLANSSDSITWSSSATAIVDIVSDDNICTLTAKKAGSAKITAKAGDLKVSCMVYVNTVSLSLSGTDVTYTPTGGYVVSLSMGSYSDVHLDFSNNSSSSVTWTSLNPNIATLYDSDTLSNSIYGALSGTTYGTAKIEDGTTLKFKIVVLNPALTDISLPSTTSYAAGTENYVFVHPLPANAHVIAYSVASSDKSVLSATHKGNGQFLLTALKAGTTTLTYTLIDDNGNMVSQSMQITVY